MNGGCPSVSPPRSSETGIGEENDSDPRSAGVLARENKAGKLHKTEDYSGKAVLYMAVEPGQHPPGTGPWCGRLAVQGSW